MFLSPLASHRVRFAPQNSPMESAICNWITTLVTVVPMACICIFLLYDFSDSLRKYPDMIPAFIGITIDLIMLTALFNNTKIRARIFFRNFIKIK